MRVEGHAEDRKIKSVSWIENWTRNFVDCGAVTDSAEWKNLEGWRLAVGGWRKAKNLLI